MWTWGGKGNNNCATLEEVGCEEDAETVEIEQYPVHTSSSFLGSNVQSKVTCK